MDRTTAHDQWRSILERPTLVPGRRGPTFLPIETLLCHGLFDVVEPSRYGGSNRDAAPEVVHQLAALFRRPSSSILAKMMNLNGKMRNSARAEPELHQALNHQRSEFDRLAVIIMSAARDLGVTSHQLPDFIDQGSDHEGTTSSQMDGGVDR